MTGVQTCALPIFDRWFVGFTPYYVASVWVGCDTPRPMSFFSGNPCIPVWKKVMQQIHTEKKLPAKAFATSAGFVSATYCTQSGKLPAELCTSKRTSYFKSGTQPSSVCGFHIVTPDETEETTEGTDDEAAQEELPPKPSASPAKSPDPTKPVDLGEPNV